MRTVLLRHSASNGARALARELGINMLRLTGSRFRPRRGDVIINWGKGIHEIGGEFTYINNPSAVNLAGDKMATFAMLREARVPTVEWTTNPQTARHWLGEGIRVIARAINRGSQGRGMTAYSYDGTEYTADYNAFCAATRTPFYVKVFGDVRTNEEYRIHVVDGEVIDRQIKRRRSRDNGNEGRTDPYIRSAANGWVFCRDGLGRTEELDNAAKEAVEALGLDFGAVDLARDSTGRCCVYEVNTAPGLEGRTISSYSTALRAARGRRASRGRTRAA